MHTSTIRGVVTLTLVGALVLSAGCSGLGLGDDAAATDAVESPATDDATEGSNESGSFGHDGHSHSHGGGNATDGDGDGSGVGNGTAADAGASAGNRTTNVTEAAASGKVTVAVAGSQLDLAARDRAGDGFGVASSDEHTWVAESTNLTLAEALSRFGVEANASHLAVDGERYDGTANGTTLTYRVDGRPVDPTEYVLEDGDMVWTTVRTNGTDVSPPGNYIRAAQQHAHGEMNFTVEGETLNFSREKYQSNHRYFHYEHGGGEYWHAHSVSVTLGFALDSLAGINVTDGAVEYEGTTYDPSDDGTTVNATVNGEPVALDEYVLQDGDSVRVTLESSG